MFVSVDNPNGRQMPNRTCGIRNPEREMKRGG
jgi:hypothetical protein